MLIILVASSFMWITPATEHAIYISVVEIENMNTTGSEIRIKVFKNDFRDAIRNDGGETIPEIDACPKNSMDLENYFNKNLELSIDKQTLPLRYRSCSLEGDAYWFIFSAETPINWTTIHIKDTHFFELFPTQSNIIRIINGEDEKLIRLTKGNSEAIVTF